MSAPRQLAQTAARGAALLAAVAVFFVGAEQGAFSLFTGTAVHEWVHDARHLLGYPCH